MKNLATSLVLAAALAAAPRAASALGWEPVCYPDDAGCRVEEASVDPSRLLCAEPAPSMEERPADVWEQAARWGKVFGVPRSWITSQARAESRNRPGAVSTAGATGVMQVKLARARDLARWLRSSEFGKLREVADVLAGKWRGLRRDLHDVELCVMLAAYDLRRLVGKFGRDHALVAAAYNQGEGKIGRCLREGRPLPARAVEYVARVMRAKRAGQT